MTSKVNITRKRGDTYAEEITVVDKDTGSSKDITGNTFKLTVNKKSDPPNEDDQVFQISGNITDAANGVVEFPFTTGNANNVGFFFYDIEATGVDIETIMEGDFNMFQDRTK